MAKEGFEKFINKPAKSGKVKEAFRQEKKTAVRERRDAIEKHYEDKRKQKAERFSTEGSNENRSFKGEGKKPYGKAPNKTAGRGAKPEAKGASQGPKGKSSYKDFEKGAAKPGARKPFVRKEEGADRKGTAASTGNRAEKPAYKKESSWKKDASSKSGGPAKTSGSRSEKPAYKKTDSRKDAPSGSDRPAKKYNGQKAAGVKPEYKKPYVKREDQTGERPPATRGTGVVKPSFRKPFEKKGPVARSERSGGRVDSKPVNYMELLPEELLMSDENGRQPDVQETDETGIVKKARINPAEKYKKKEKTPVDGAKPAFKKKQDKEVVVIEDMPLNKFIAHAGICSRRDAADVVRGGKVTVNGEKITEPAFKVTDDADVRVDGEKIQRSRNQVYILLNKPKDYITTTDDPQDRKTVMEIIKHATTERVYPVGRLDRNTSGVLLFTNDGDLAQKLSHPSFEVRKIYEVKLDKALQQDDFEKILSGVKLEDGEVHADSLAYGDKDKSVVGIEIHSGKNRVVRRIFEKLGYDVRGLDRVMYANLTKKNVERGKWRFLNDKEVRLLKYFNKSKA